MTGTQAPRDSRTNWHIVAKGDLRPAGDGKHCFYCSKPLGAEHEQDCVIRRHAGYILVTIRKNATGEERTYRHDMRWEAEGDQYMWSEGNYSCDCNRYLFFQRAHDEDEEDFECGDTAYTVVKIVTDDGAQVYAEGSTPSGGADGT